MAKTKELVKQPQQMDASRKLSVARSRLLSIYPWYGYFALHMIWKESDMAHVHPEEARTMAVYITNGQVVCIWYRAFVEKLTIGQLVAVIQHEIEHIVRMHCQRRSDRDPQAWNIAVDMVVNGTKNNPRIGYVDGSVKILPFDDHNKLVWIPEDWPSNETSEFFYNKLMEETAKKSKNAAGNFPQPFDIHSFWNNNDCSPEEMRRIVLDRVQKASQQGKVPGHLEEAIKELQEPIVDWARLLSQYIGQYVGNRRYTYSRRNRRRDEFGVPGTSRHAASRIMVIVDTSGSISTTDLERFFAEIERMASSASIRVVQWDVDLTHDNKNYRRRDWQKISVHGRGGTDMGAALEWVGEQQERFNVVVLLTDGYTGYGKKQQFPLITCLTTDDGHRPEYGVIIDLHKGKVKATKKK